jgi:3-hydroxyisobutyrate dehydrogenase
MTGTTQRVAVLGTGTMGAPIARNLLHAGFDVSVWNRTAARAAALAADGAHVASTPAEAASGADVVITMLTDGPAVAHVMTGPAGAASTVALGALWLQMSTVGVEWADRLAGLAGAHGIAFVDAPVSGSSEAAQQQDLIILASGAISFRRELRPIFAVLGRDTVWLDSVGDGSRLKLALNNWLAVLVEGVVESLTLSEALGLDPRLFLRTVADGPMACDYALAKGSAMLNARFVPGFPLRHAAKDAELALDAAHRHGIELPMTSALLPRWHQAIEGDHGGEDVAAAVTAAATTASPPGARLMTAAP